MDQYTIYCTAEQTKKALKLGAPISTTPADLFNNSWMKVTAEQMIGWLEEQGLICDIFPLEDDRDKRAFAFRIGVKWNKYESDAQDYTSRKEATLAAIDVALDYLIKMKK